MKKVLAVLLVGVLALGTFACGNEKSNTGNEKSKVEATNTIAPTTVESIFGGVDTIELTKSTLNRLLVASDIGDYINFMHGTPMAEGLASVKKQMEDYGWDVYERDLYVNFKDKWYSWEKKN